MLLTDAEPPHFRREWSNTTHAPRLYVADGVIVLAIKYLGQPTQVSRRILQSLLEVRRICGDADFTHRADPVYVRATFTPSNEARSCTRLTKDLASPINASGLASAPRKARGLEQRRIS